MRLIVLEYFGGFYLDLDVECRRPLSDYLRDHVNVSCIFDRERFMQSMIQFKAPFISMNDVIISRPAHPFMKLLVNKLPAKSKKSERIFPYNLKLGLNLRALDKTSESAFSLRWHMSVKRHKWSKGE